MAEVRNNLCHFAPLREKELQGRWETMRSSYEILRNVSPLREKELPGRREEKKISLRLGAHAYGRQALREKELPGCIVT